MKINNTNIFNIYSNYNLNKVDKIEGASNPIAKNVSDSLSFSGFDVSLIFPRSIAQIKEDALDNSIAIAQKSIDIKQESQNIFDNALSKYQDAKDLITLGHDLYFRNIDDESDELHIKFEKYDDDSQDIDTMFEYDKYGNIKRKTIFSDSLEPLVIMEYSELSEKYSEYSFEKGIQNLRYLTGVDVLGGEDYKVDKSYQFDNGQISRYEEMITHIGDLNESKEVFEFSQDNSFEYISNERKYGRGHFYKNEIYSFLNGKLKTYTKDSNVIPGTYQSNMGITIQYDI